MESNVVDLHVVKKVAAALQELRPSFAFVGGSIVSLYIDDPLADPVRQTMDVDLSTSLQGYGGWARLQEELMRLGFVPDPNSKIICRHLYQGITVDIMPDDEKILGFSNPWYKSGLANMEQIHLGDGIDINLLPLPYFIATKFSALNARGRGDHRTSHDFDDIVYVIDNTSDVVERIAKSADVVREYLRSQFKIVRDHDNRWEIITAHLREQMKEIRYPVIVRKIEEIIKVS